MDDFITDIFDWRNLFVPVCIEHTAKRKLGETVRTYRTLRVFGVRLARWDTTKSGITL